MSTSPLYRSVHTDLRERIVAGRYAPGALLPSERRLVEAQGRARGEAHTQLAASARPTDSRLWVAPPNCSSSSLARVK